MTDEDLARTDRLIHISNGWAVNLTLLEQYWLLTCQDVSSLTNANKNFHSSANKVKADKAIVLEYLQHYFLKDSLWNTGDCWRCFIGEDGEWPENPPEYREDDSLIRYSVSIFAKYQLARPKQLLYTTHYDQVRPWVRIDRLPAPLNEFAHYMHKGTKAVFKLTRHMPGYGALATEDYLAVGLFRLLDVCEKPANSVESIVNYLVEREFLQPEAVDPLHVVDQRTAEQKVPAIKDDVAFYDGKIHAPDLNLPLVWCDGDGNLFKFPKDVPSDDEDAIQKAKQEQNELEAEILVIRKEKALAKKREEEAKEREAEQEARLDRAFAEQLLLQQEPRLEAPVGHPIAFGSYPSRPITDHPVSFGLNPFKFASELDSAQTVEDVRPCVSAGSIEPASLSDLDNTNRSLNSDLPDGTPGNLSDVAEKAPSYAAVCRRNTKA